MDPASLIAYAAALAIAAAIPGPGIAALVGQAMGGGPRPALFFLGGIVLGDITYLTIAIAGLAALAQIFSTAFLAVKILGGLYLLFLARKIWRSPNIPATAQSRKTDGPKALLVGYTVTMGNPKAIIFYLALLPGVIDLTMIGMPQWAMLAALTALILIAALTPYILLAQKARTHMARSGTLTRINRLAATIIGGAGLLILGQAARSLQPN